jgi:hypothetical protein
MPITEGSMSSADSYSAAPPPSCPHCGCARTARIARTTFMQLIVLHRVGLFPWECRYCRKDFMFKSRGRHRRTHQINGVRIPTTS